MPSRIGLVIGCIGGTGRKSVEESGREWVGGVGQDDMSASRPASGELSSITFRGSSFVSRLSKSCMELLERFSLVTSVTLFVTV